MRALLVYESMFGNTQRIAKAIAAGLSSIVDVTVTDVAHAPALLPADIEAIVVGGPTHAFSMSRPQTRQQAAARGAHGDVADRGIREWLAGLPAEHEQLPFVAFDTRVDMPLVPGAASHSASRFARKHGFHVLEPQSFLVEGYEGPLVDGELERAQSWGEGLARVLTGD
jgi:hypothetical protein